MIAFDKTGHGPAVILVDGAFCSRSLGPEDAASQLTEFIASGRRGDAVKFFMTKVMNAPAMFVFMMRLMPTWSRLKAVAGTLPYDAAVMRDYSLPAKRLASVAIPTLAIDRENSPAPLRKAVQAVARAVPNGQYRMLKGQNHNVSIKVLAPVVKDFFAALSSTEPDRRPQ